MVDAMGVMIVDDDPDTRDMLERFLQLEGFAVETAPNGEVALASLRSGSSPCVILLDLMMPVMNGWQFRAAQCEDPGLAQIPVVVVTAGGTRRDLPAIEANAWLSKPLDFDQLLAAIDGFCSPRSA